MAVTIGWAVFDAAQPPTSVTIGFAEFDTQFVTPQIYGSGGARTSYHDDDAPLQRQVRIRVHAENDEEEQIVLNLIMEFARHVL